MNMRTGSSAADDAPGAFPVPVSDRRKMMKTWREIVNGLDAVTRRRFLERAGLASAVIGLGALSLGTPGIAEAGQAQVAGTGRVQDPLVGVTIPSPSDFGFAAHRDGGTFVCSMFGPETGGFINCILMTVQGNVTPGSLVTSARTATFSGKVDIFLFPDVINNQPFLLLEDNDYTVTATLGGPGKASMVLHIPNTYAALGGDTGGIVQVGAIKRQRIQTT
jgi:hypothetical protein